MKNLLIAVALLCSFGAQAMSCKDYLNKLHNNQYPELSAVETGELQVNTMKHVTERLKADYGPVGYVEKMQVYVAAMEAANEDEITLMDDNVFETCVDNSRQLAERVIAQETLRHMGMIE